MAFTEQENQQAAHLFGLIKRQMSMGIPDHVVIVVLASVAGQTAAEMGLDREICARLVPTMQAGYDGHIAGKKQAKDNNNGG